MYGYRGKHLELTVPDMAFDRCDAGDLRSWIAPMDAAEEGDAFYGYTGPGYREEFWILDVDGTRLMIAAGRSPARRPRTSPSCVPSSTPYGSNRELAREGRDLVELG